MTRKGFGAAEREGPKKPLEERWPGGKGGELRSIEANQKTIHHERQSCFSAERNHRPTTTHAAADEWHQLHKEGKKRTGELQLMQ